MRRFAVYPFKGDNVDWPKPKTGDFVARSTMLATRPLTVQHTGA